MDGNLLHMGDVDRITDAWVPLAFLCCCTKKDTRSGVFFYGADDQIRTDYLVLTKDALYLLSYISELAGAEGFEPSARGFGDHCSTN